MMALVGYLREDLRGITMGLNVFLVSEEEAEVAEERGMRAVEGGLNAGFDRMARS